MAEFVYTLLSEFMRVLRKSFFPLNKYIRKHCSFFAGSFWVFCWISNLFSQYFRIWDSAEEVIFSIKQIFILTWYYIVYIEFPHRFHHWEKWGESSSLLSHRVEYLSKDALKCMCINDVLRRIQCTKYKNIINTSQWIDCMLWKLVLWLFRLIFEFAYVSEKLNSCHFSVRLQSVFGQFSVNFWLVFLQFLAIFHRLFRQFPVNFRSIFGQFSANLRPVFVQFLAMVFIQFSVLSHSLVIRVGRNFSK